MNKTYIWTSGTFTGSVLFTFNEQGLLLKYDVTEASLTGAQLTWFVERLPKTFEELKKVLSTAKQSKLEVLPDLAITFELFWNRYNEKERSSKKKSLKVWNRLAPNEQAKAYLHIPKYFKSIGNGIATKYAETYLNAELWNN